MEDNMKIIELENVVIRFSGDSGDGMQLAGSIFSDLSATLGNDISTFPDYPAEIRAPQGTISGVSGFQVHIGKNRVFTPGDKCDVLVAMNPAALKTQLQHTTKQTIIIIDSDSFSKRDLEKALFTTEDPFLELSITNEVIAAPIGSICLESLKESGLDRKTVLRSKNMFALGLVCWLFNRPLAGAERILNDKFGKKPEIAQANIKILNDGYNFGANTHATVTTYRIESTDAKEKGFYTELNGNTATAYGLIAAAEKSGLELFLGSYPITPATDILQELAKRKDLGVKTIQAEDEIAAVCTAIGASFAGSLGVTTTSGPGLCLKSEAINLAVMAEIPLVVINVQRGGPSTGLPTKSEQTDLLQALYGRNGESPLVVIAATSPTNCFDSAYMACKLAIEHMTPVILLTDGYIANGSAAWKIPNLETYPAITPNYVNPSMTNWKPYQRDEKSKVRHWAVPGMPDFMHRLGGLEKDFVTGGISTQADNHQKMVETRRAKIEHIAQVIPDLTVHGDSEAELLVVGWGGTYGHLYSAVELCRAAGHKIALAHFQYINPLPKNTKSVFANFKKIIVVEQNTGQFAGYLRMKLPEIALSQFNRIKGKPFNISRLVEEFTNLIAE